MFRLHRAAIVSSKPSSPERIPRKQFFFPSRRFGFGCLINGWTEYASESIFHFQKPQHATIPGTRVVELFTTKLEKKNENKTNEPIDWNGEIQKSAHFTNFRFKLLNTSADSIRMIRWTERESKWNAHELSAVRSRAHSEVRIWAVFDWWTHSKCL